MGGFNKEIVGFEYGKFNDNVLIIKSNKKLFPLIKKLNINNETTIFPSNHGYQYNSKVVKSLCKKQKFSQSMSAKEIC